VSCYLWILLVTWKINARAGLAKLLSLIVRSGKFPMTMRRILYKLSLFTGSCIGERITWNRYLPSQAIDKSYTTSHH